MMSQEVIGTNSQDSDDLITEFFSLVETPVSVTEVEAVELKVGGYFAETISWLEQVDSPSNISSIDYIYQLQDMAITQQLLCACVAHSSPAADSFLSAPFSPSYDMSYAFSEISLQSTFSHEGHEHCSCGGHYKEGKCENCGSLKHND